ncbi:MAG: hypothetical protein QOJ65_1504, partial [Fimbriimonadaceae bacterium]|nr:hypothetical protein [Fimbriimonadaceae bacterium]
MRPWPVAALLLLAAGCHKTSGGETIEAQAQAHIDALNGQLDDQKQSDELRALYGCGPYAVTPIQDTLKDQDYRARTQLINVLGAIPDDRVEGTLLQLVRSRRKEDRRQACYGLSLFPKVELHQQ